MREKITLSSGYSLFQEIYSPSLHLRLQDLSWTEKGTRHCFPPFLNGSVLRRSAKSSAFRPFSTFESQLFSPFKYFNFSFPSANYFSHFSHLLFKVSGSSSRQQTSDTKLWFCGSTVTIKEGAKPLTGNQCRVGTMFR